jgi:hypothetical protein
MEGKGPEKSKEPVTFHYKDRRVQVRQLGDHIAGGEGLHYAAKTVHYLESQIDVALRNPLE